MTYLQLVNSVLARLRETSVSTVAQNSYSTLIGTFINDAKRQVEDAWSWEALSTTLTVNTDGVNDRFIVTGSGKRHKMIGANDTTNKSVLRQVSLAWINHQNQISDTTPAQPVYYAWSGSDGTDSYITFFPRPNGAYAVKLNMYVPQTDLSADATAITIPHESVVAGAYARALVERGEDGGLSGSEAYGLFKGILADAIALESQRNADSDTFEAV